MPIITLFIVAILISVVIWGSILLLGNKMSIHGALLDFYYEEDIQKGISLTIPLAFLICMGVWVAMQPGAFESTKGPTYEEMKEERLRYEAKKEVEKENRAIQQAVDNLRKEGYKQEYRGR